MTAPPTLEEIHSELLNLYNDLNREQSKLFTRAMALKNKMHEVKELAEQVKDLIIKQEDYDTEKTAAEAK